MKKQRVRISIALLLSSTLVFFGITYYLISNTYQLKKNSFHYKSTNLVSEIFFSTPIDFDEFEKNIAIYQKLITIKNSKQGISSKSDRLMSTIQNAFIQLKNIDQKIDEAFQHQGIDIGTNISFSISRIVNQPNLDIKQEILESQLKNNELILFGDDKELDHSDFYTFHHTNEGIYFQSKLYIRYSKIRNYLLMEMKELLFGIILVMIIIFSVFIYTIQTIRRQKKLADIKNDFINNMTHELNTPISTITVAGQNLMKGNVNQKPELVSELASTIIRQNKRLHKIVSEVMEASQLDSGNITPDLKTCSLHDLINEIIADFKTRNQYKELEITTDLKAINDIIALDTFKFTSAIYNLLDNAVKYSNNPLKINISTKNDENCIVLQISDNGIGISPSDQKMIFEKFYRVPHGNIHKVKGLGLGLFLVKQIIQAHKGKIEMKSQLGNGSSFIIYLPN